MEVEPKKALIIVDVQNDFCPGGSLAVAHGEEVVAPLNKLMKEFLDRGEPVFKTRDWHPAKTKHFQCTAGRGRCTVSRTQRALSFILICSTTRASQRISKGFDESADGYSGFDGTRLAETLREEGVEEVWIGGLATDYCVKETVLDARREGFKVKALADAMRPVNLNPDDGEKAVAEMSAAGAEIVGSRTKAAGRGE